MAQDWVVVEDEPAQEWSVVEDDAPEPDLVPIPEMSLLDRWKDRFKPISKEQSAQEDIDSTRAQMLGLTNMATWGAAPLISRASARLQGLPDPTPMYDEAADKHPVDFYGSQIAGGLAMPLAATARAGGAALLSVPGVAKMVGTGTLAGGLGGFFGSHAGADAKGTIIGDDGKFFGKGAELSPENIAAKMPDTETGAMYGAGFGLAVPAVAGALRIAPAMRGALDRLKMRVADPEKVMKYEQALAGSQEVAPQARKAEGVWLAPSNADDLAAQMDDAAAANAVPLGEPMPRPPVQPPPAGEDSFLLKELKSVVDGSPRAQRGMADFSAAKKKSGKSAKGTKPVMSEEEKRLFDEAQNFHKEAERKAAKKPGIGPLRDETAFDADEFKPDSTLQAILAKIKQKAESPFEPTSQSDLPLRTKGEKLTVERLKKAGVDNPTDSQIDAELLRRDRQKLDYAEWLDRGDSAQENHQVLSPDPMTAAERKALLEAYQQTKAPPQPPPPLEPVIAPPLDLDVRPPSQRSQMVADELRAKWADEPPPPQLELGTPTMPSMRGAAQNYVPPAEMLQAVPDAVRPPATFKPPVEVPGWRGVGADAARPGPTSEAEALLKRYREEMMRSGTDRLADAAGSVGNVLGMFADSKGGLLNRLGGSLVGERAGRVAFHAADKTLSGASWLSDALSSVTGLKALQAQGGQLGSAASWILAAGANNMGARAATVATQPWFRQVLAEQSKGQSLPSQ